MPSYLILLLLLLLHFVFTFVGTITGLRNYGAFLELDGGMAGLLHISQISYDRVDNLETLFTIGQRCKVFLCSILFNHMISFHLIVLYYPFPPLLFNRIPLR